MPVLEQAVIRAISEAKDKAEIDFTNLCILIKILLYAYCSIQN
jgi:hypothetical protein